MSHEADEELLSAYLDGELTADEQARVEQRLAKHPAYRQLYDELRALRTSFEALPRHQLHEDLSKRVLRRAERTMLKVVPSVESTAAESSPAEKPVVAAEAGNHKAAAHDCAAIAANAEADIEPFRLRFPRGWRPWLWPAIALAAGLYMMLFNPQEHRKIAKAPPQAPVAPSDASIGAGPSSATARTDAQTDRATDRAADNKAQRLGEISETFKGIEAVPDADTLAEPPSQLARQLKSQDSAIGGAQAPEQADEAAGVGSYRNRATPSMQADKQRVAGNQTQSGRETPLSKRAIEADAVPAKGEFAGQAAQPENASVPNAGPAKAKLADSKFADTEPSSSEPDGGGIAEQQPAAAKKLPATSAGRAPQSSKHSANLARKAAEKSAADRDMRNGSPAENAEGLASQKQSAAEGAARLGVADSIAKDGDERAKKNAGQSAPAAPAAVPPTSVAAERAGDDSAAGPGRGAAAPGAALNSLGLKDSGAGKDGAATTAFGGAAAAPNDALPAEGVLVVTCTIRPAAVELGAFDALLARHQIVFGEQGQSAEAPAGPPGLPSKDTPKAQGARNDLAKGKSARNDAADKEADTKNEPPAAASPSPEQLAGQSAQGSPQDRTENLHRSLDGRQETLSPAAGRKSGNIGVPVVIEATPAQIRAILADMRQDSQDFAALRVEPAANAPSQRQLARYSRGEEINEEGKQLRTNEAQSGQRQQRRAEKPGETAAGSAPAASPSEPNKAKPATVLKLKTATAQQAASRGLAGGVGGGAGKASDPSAADQVITDQPSLTLRSENKPAAEPGKGAAQAKGPEPVKGDEPVKADESAKGDESAAKIRVLFLLQVDAPHEPAAPPPQR